jgi:hypothetical protein
MRDEVGADLRLRVPVYRLPSTVYRLPSTGASLRLCPSHHRSTGINYEYNLPTIEGAGA